ncbi:hypothetical protein ACHHYP_06821 [Achlya hypogyna]|uniref:Zinc finger PHD-type domain-containing protein n=1 Tax=Achlya hypogyna TaxID=1202772 RepID=A0A1V9YRY8_ACHHY|nr:hypothetical protein ACHHYP_06821 [Achlya hypogyna]
MGRNDNSKKRKPEAKPEVKLAVPKDTVTTLRSYEPCVVCGHRFNVDSLLRCSACSTFFHKRCFAVTPAEKIGSCTACQTTRTDEIKLQDKRKDKELYAPSTGSGKDLFAFRMTMLHNIMLKKITKPPAKRSKKGKKAPEEIVILDTSAEMDDDDTPSPRVKSIPEPFEPPQQNTVLASEPSQESEGSWAIQPSETHDMDVDWPADNIKHSVANCTDGVVAPKSTFPREAVSESPITNAVSMPHSARTPPPETAEPHGLTGPQSAGIMEQNPSVPSSAIRVPASDEQCNEVAGSPHSATPDAVASDALNEDVSRSDVSLSPLSAKFGNLVSVGCSSGILTDVQRALRLFEPHCGSIVLVTRSSVLHVKRCLGDGAVAGFCGCDPAVLDYGGFHTHSCLRSPSHDQRADPEQCHRRKHA